MERHKFIYLTGLLPVLVCPVLTCLWILFALPPLAWLGLIMSPLAFLISLIGCYHAFVYYTDKSVSDKERKLRRKHFLGHTTALSLGLALSYQSFQYFKTPGTIPGAAEGLTIRVKNTSMQPAKDIHIQVGLFNETIKEIPSQGEKVFQTQLSGETNLTAEIGSGDTARKAMLLVGPTNHLVLVRIDPLQNLLPSIN